MILLFVIYALAFVISLAGILKGNIGRVFLFIILGLPIYFTALSIAYINGMGAFIPLLQSFKEIIILISLGVLIYHRKQPIHLHTLDWLIIAYFSYTLIYTLLPLGDFSFTDRLLAFKSLSFFPFVYFTGRLLDVSKINFNTYFSYICIVAILAGCVLIIEAIRYEHLQLYTGYAEFNRQFFKQEPGGNFGLSWTFETSNGLKRFASFYGGPLELGVNTVCTVAVAIALSTNDKNRFQPSNLIIATLAFSLYAIFMALSRAAFVSYFFIIYIYAFLTENKTVLKIFHYGIIAAIIAGGLWLQGDLYDWVMNTIDFSDSSSAFHVMQWLDGLNAIQTHPLGMGIGMSGRVSSANDSNVGGENQLIIIGVQAGLVAVLLYIAIYIYTIRTCIKVFRHTTGKSRKPALALLLIKIGIIIPLLTANTESYMYLSYFSWLLTGIVANLIKTPPLFKQPLPLQHEK